MYDIVTIIRKQGLCKYLDYLEGQTEFANAYRQHSNSRQFQIFSLLKIIHQQNQLSI